MRRYFNIYKRDVDGILLLDKPSGFSSSFISWKIKKFFCAKKVGHAGTLDPLATGMLPVFFGKSTKLIQHLLFSDKRYRVVAKLGESTDSFDADGIVVRVSPIQFTINQLESCLYSFIGERYQTPPIFSSIKYQGLPLYKYARKGICVPIKPRLVRIYQIYVVKKELNFIELDIQCSKGTYVRSFINDLGECLGCGAHVIKLRRLMVGPYLYRSMIDFKKLESIFYNSGLSDIEVLNALDAFLIPTQ